MTESVAAMLVNPMVPNVTDYEYISYAYAYVAK